MPTEWKINGELVLNCNCNVFCPCVISLGKHPPTEGYCHGWGAIAITDGYFGETRLDGLNVGILLDIPGKMANGNWTAALYVDERASDAAVAGLEQIFAGQAGGTTGLFSMLVSTYLGTKRAPITIERDGKTRHVTIGPKVLQASVAPVPGASRDDDLVITNTQYWMGPDVTVANASKAKFRDFGRVWDLSGKSAEIVPIAWAGP
ncbi:MAG: DUF1326 domain-containing protein [Rhodospirillaceae bacterium]